MFRVLMAVTLAGSLLFSHQALAAKVEVSWQEPSKFTDVQPAEEPRERFQSRVFEEFERYFERLARDLPDDHTLHITVSDLNLMGDVETQNTSTGLRQMRVVRNYHRPQMDFTYELRDANDNVVMSGEETLRGRDTYGRADFTRRARSQSDFLNFEKDMLDRWFRQTFRDS